jgi:hypothetical protein
VSALVAGTPRRAAALDDTVRDVLIATGAALTLGAVVGLVIYLVQEPYEPPKPAAPPRRSAAAPLPSFQALGLRPLPVAAVSQAPSPSLRPALLRF